MKRNKASGNRAQPTKKHAAESKAENAATLSGPVSPLLRSGRSRVDANRTAPGGSEYRHPGAADRPQPTAVNSIVMETGNTKNSALMAKKAPTMPKPQWHPPWKLYRVISGHLGWVRCIAVEPGNQWFVTGSADRTIKIWDLASGKLKLSLTGHISTVRGVIVSTRSPYLFSCGEDKQVKCWDLEYNKVIRHYHGHLSAVYGLDLHPTIDVLVTCSRDSTARIWDVRTKASVHTLSGHTNAVATVRCQAAEPQIITADNGTMHLWDWRTGYNFQRVHAAVQPGSLDSESGIFACAFDQSESRLLTAEADKTIKVYREDDTATEETHPISWKPEIIKRKRF
ncbi:Pleiotropic regulator 1 [Tupaia chinensis]|uniref:Pleiotropic regulator 1 n=1 Tax=Tupaia chinensis TaxID=246437 RepID=L8Y659_TUPCH|nr:Pleiotropic regulator 1 [Tupaia chinensis]